MPGVYRGGGGGGGGEEENINRWDGEGMGYVMRKKNSTGNIFDWSCLAKQDSCRVNIYNERTNRHKDNQRCQYKHIQHTRHPRAKLKLDVYKFLS